MAGICAGTCIGSLGAEKLSQRSLNHAHESQLLEENAADTTPTRAQRQKNRAAAAGRSDHDRAAALDSRGEGRVVGVGEHGLGVEEVNGARLRQEKAG